MSEPWFDPQSFGGILGATFGCTAGLWGGVSSYLASRGKCRRLVMGVASSIFAAVLLCLILGIYAYNVGQPHGVWYGFGLVGMIGCVIFPFQINTIRKKFAESESRQMQAEDLL